jgi:hypothetical protein
MTCQDCLTLRHYRCRGCDCEICRRTRARVKVPKPARPARRKSPAPRSQRTPSEYSTTPKATYMRAYRARKARGETLGSYRRTTPEMVEAILEARSRGLTWRAVGEEVGVDYSYARRLALAATETSTEARRT